MFPLIAKDIAFMNSVVLGTRAKRVIPRNFSSIPDPLRTTSTTSTRSSEKSHKFENNLQFTSLQTSNQRIKEGASEQDTCTGESAP